LLELYVEVATTRHKTADIMDNKSFASESIIFKVKVEVKEAKWIQLSARW
jgi:hypothetical protein